MIGRTSSGHRVTPDGRYFVVRGRLWRLANPDLDPERREELVSMLMRARRALRDLPLGAARSAARLQIDEVKTKLGERGPVWWFDGSPDFNRVMVKNSPYATWHADNPP